MINYLINNIRNKPLIQAIFCLGLALMIQFVTFIYFKIKGSLLDATDIWFICPVMLLFFVLFNVVFGFEQKNIGVYYRDSIYGFIGIMAVDIFSSQLLTDKTVFEVKSISWIIMVFCIVYLVFISILNLIRFIMLLVLKQDKNIQDQENLNR